MIKNGNWLWCEVLVILIKLEFSRKFSNIPRISNFMKIIPMGAGLYMRTGRHDGANSWFSQFCERAKKNYVACSDHHMRNWDTRNRF